MKIPAAFAALLLAGACAAQPPPPAETTGQRVARILSEVPLTDGHNDWPIALRGAHGYPGALVADLSVPAASRFGTGHTTLQWLRDGKVGAQLWSAYVSANLAPEEAVKQTFEQIDVVHSIIDRHPEKFALVTTADAMEAASVPDALPASSHWKVRIR